MVTGFFQSQTRNLNSIQESIKRTAFRNASVVSWWDQDLGNPGSNPFSAVQAYQVILGQSHSRSLTKLQGCSEDNVEDNAGSHSWSPLWRKVACKLSIQTNQHYKDFLKYKISPIASCQYYFLKVAAVLRSQSKVVTCSISNVRD